MSFEGTQLKILNLAAAIAETEDYNVAFTLQKLQEIVKDCPPGSKIGIKVRQHIWNYDILHVCSTALLQDYSCIDKGWDIAAKLCSILCQCCDGSELTTSIQFNETFLPNLLENMLDLCFKIQEVYLAAEAALRHELYINLKKVTDSLSWLVNFSPSLNMKAMESKKMMQMLMVEDAETSLLILSLIHNILKRDRNILDKSSDGTRSSLLDELIYKIAASEDISIGRLACQLLLLFIDRQPSVVDLLSSQKYRGLKTYLSKWKEKGFDNDLKKLTAILEAGDVAHAELMKKESAASIIKAYYKGYKERKMLQRMNVGVVKFQRLYRQYIRKQEERLKIKLQRDKHHHENISRQRDFRESLNKNLITLEHVPANKVQEYFLETQNVSAIKIQSAFRGMQARRQIKLRREKVLHDAACVIQRQYRSHLKRKNRYRKITFDLEPNELDDTRRTEIQEKILRFREKMATKVWNEENVKQRHYETQRLLESHLMIYGKSRKTEQRREALLAKLNVDAELLLASPQLKDANMDIINTYTSQSTPVVRKAQLDHAKELSMLRAPWWKKLSRDNNVYLVEDKSVDEKNEDLNF
ncbi:LOW QUALITY PROTEIN: IQ calmodulin-binding motif-containing protein 1-like [Xenia sp. Carnegie-2017]|uniref:LOW QUALITY PROTEIN: IQ calmodulin-binding motif-containing protein 1-like n=1 Tax=Xenia sp. Carnegie-2017 TaxID=2897299 RepID=UPI001F043D0E|nr:LOW QUALITY PROTEIN: IQ calmodulin-binding motif-containing protein 1-like [Xenia sp. Carnegie-2017]